jgi:phosphoribosylformylglycinamidine (FGAM) synthase-like enzyme
MSPYEIMLSESQERMLIVVTKGREAEVQRVFEKWDLPWSEIGVVTNTGRMVVRHHGAIVVDLPAAQLANLTCTVTGRIRCDRLTIASKSLLFPRADATIDPRFWAAISNANSLMSPLSQALRTSPPNATCE